MSVSIAITEVATGITAIHAAEEWNEFIWTDGNYACDCNRWIFHRRASGEDPDIDDSTCGEGAFIIHVTDESGNVLYSERKPA